MGVHNLGSTEKLTSLYKLPFKDTLHTQYPRSLTDKLLEAMETVDDLGKTVRLNNFVSSSDMKLSELPVSTIARTVRPCMVVSTNDDDNPETPQTEAIDTDDLGEERQTLAK